MTRRGDRQRSRSGGILFEVLLSIAVFAAGASFVLAAARGTLDAQHRSLREQQASDLAATLMAELRMGTLSLTELREGLPRDLGSIEGFRERIDQRVASGGMSWSVDINTQRSEFPGLTLVELTVAATGESERRVDESGTEMARFTLRELVRLRGEDAEEFQQDELLEGLPTNTGGGGP